MVSPSAGLLFLLCPQPFDPHVSDHFLPDQRGRHLHRDHRDLRSGSGVFPPLHHHIHSTRETCRTDRPILCRNIFQNVLRCSARSKLYEWETIQTDRNATSSGLWLRRGSRDVWLRRGSRRGVYGIQKRLC